MAIAPPADRLWWRAPVPRGEILWIAASFVWGLVMFFTMIYWHAYGNQNLSNETYRTTPMKFSAKLDEMVSQYQVRDDNGIPVVRPPAGGDVYMLGRTWMWYPHIELVKGQSYKFHLSALDLQHGFSLQPVNVNFQVHPGYEHVMTFTPNQTGEFSVVCNEFCGLGHHLMLGKIYVVEQ